MPRETGVPFVNACLWDFCLKADIGFCVDVMEHIPPEKVGDVLDRIKDAVGRVFFQINYGKDGVWPAYS